MSTSSSTASIALKTSSGKGNLASSSFQSCKPTAKTTLIVIDSAVEDYEILLKGVTEGANLLILNPDHDGVEQITHALQNNGTITSLHIISHGAPGCLRLGSSELSLATLDRYAWNLQTWFSALPFTDIPAMLLYGCDVAAGDAGAEFLEKLHQLTGASVATSATATDSEVLGGN